VHTRQLLKNISGTAIIGTVSFIIYSISALLLGRYLSEADWGYFSFFHSATSLFTVFVLVGLDGALIRFLGRSGLEQYAWKTMLREKSAILLALSTAFSLAIKAMYQIPWLDLCIMIAVIWSGGLMALGTVVLRLREVYLKAQTLTHLWRLIFFVGVVGLLFSGGLRIRPILLVFLLSYLLPVLLLKLDLRGIPQGDREAPIWTLYREGILFFGLTSSSMIMVHIDKFFVARMLDYSAVGAYTAISFVVLTGYTMIGGAISYVLMPTLAKGENINIRKNVLLLSLVAGGVSLFYLLFGGSIIHWIYLAKYDGHFELIVLFILIGAVQLFYAIPSSVIGGKGTTKDLRIFLCLSIIAFSLNIVLNLTLIPYYQLVGAAVATWVAWIWRCASGFWVVHRMSCGEGIGDW